MKEKRDISSDTDVYNTGYKDCEFKYKTKVAELRKTVFEKLTYVGSCLEDYNDETDTGAERFNEEVEAMIDTLKSIRQDINDFGCEKPSKDKTDIEISRSYVSKSVVGSQNREDDLRAETFLKSLGHGKGKIEEEEGKV